MKRKISLGKQEVAADLAVLKKLRARVAKAPEDPGVYRWMDADGAVLYVGKAKNVRLRLRSYVSPEPDAALGPWKLSLISQITDFDVTVVTSELEALVLETNLIKQLRPKYNVLMKDDKNYVYVRITVQDPYPRIDIVRRMEEDGAKYFGPKTSAEDVRRTLAFLRAIFPFRTCKMSIVPAEGAAGGAEREGAAQTDASQPRDAAASGDSIPLDVVCTHKDRPTPCLDHHIGHCTAPCVGTRTPEEYRRESIDGVIQFLKGDQSGVASILRARMQEAATGKKFELAAKLRDQLTSLETLAEKQLVSDTSGEDTDYIGVALLSGRAHVVVLQERGGKVIGENSFSLQGRADGQAGVLAQFLAQYYSDATELPATIILAESPGDEATFEQWLTEKRGKSVKLKIPERGKKSKLLELAEKNAASKAKQAEAKWEAEGRNVEDALEELRTALELPGTPERIEGYDISHLGGTETVGSMVVMRGGKPANDHYRSFTIHSLRSGVVDDYRSLQEVLARRLRHLKGGLEQEEERWARAGVRIGKARKDEVETIREIIRQHPRELSDDDLDYKTFLVARRENEVIAFARIFPHPTGLQELRSVCVVPEERGSKLGQFVVRSILRRVKKGKIYITIDPRLEEYYAALGFRYVQKVPPVLQEKMERAAQEDPVDLPGIAMVYEAKEHKIDPSLETAPDLLVIDGGKGQLSAVAAVLKEFELEIPVIALAKREEEVFVPGREAPVVFRPDSPAKFLLMRLRDEAHRFANRHRERRISSHAVRSVLDTIPGIGPETKMALLKKFGSIDRVRSALDEELAEVLTEEQIASLRSVL